jgi:hypothetical protein
MIASHYLVIIKKTASHYNCKSLARKKKNSQAPPQPHKKVPLKMHQKIQGEIMQP